MAEIGHIKSREITAEMEESYIDYAMSVIVARALPDVRDGLKPVHRRILYSMHGMGLGPGAKHRKSAAVVGDVLGKYHPHGDIAVYDALVRMAQDFSLRYPLVNGQGNFGSIDGDPAAAQRYTETKMSSLAEEMLEDIDKDTVDWADNYDATRREPTVLPASIPQLLLNGSMGIAVGMATNIPPHNLAEVADALIWLIDHPKAISTDLMRFIKGPDFPTGGEIYNQNEVIQAYTTGKGRIITRAKSEIVEQSKDKFQIVITEIPYQVNKASLIKRIAELVKNKNLPDIKNIRDESDKLGLRIAIDLKKDSFPQKVLNRLFKLTDLEKPFYLNMLALVDGIQPRVLTIKEVLDYYLKHRKEVITRRTKFDLKKTQERIHILKGLKLALRRINEVIRTIKSSKDRATAHKNLMKKFRLTSRQAEAILEMKLQTLAGLERKKILDELTEKMKLEAQLKAVLKSSKKVSGIVKKDLEQLKLKYGDPRRTRVFVRSLGKLTAEDLIEEEDTMIVLTKGGYIKRLDPSSYRAQKRGGKGIIGTLTRDGDIVEHFVLANTLDNLLFFTDRGKVYRIRAYKIPKSRRTARGQALVNFIEIPPRELVTSIFAYRLTPKQNSLRSKKQKVTQHYLVMATKNGIIKKTKLGDFDTVRRSGLIAIRLKKDDRLSWVKPSSGKDQALLVTAQGLACRFKETDIRAMGRAASGVVGIRLKKGDEVVGMDVIKKSKIKNQKSAPRLLVLTENGFSKKTALTKYKVQKRGGKGLITAKISSKTGRIVYAKVLTAQEVQDFLIISQKGQIIRTPLKNISQQGRATQGVRVMRLKGGDKVASAICI